MGIIIPKMGMNNLFSNILFSNVQQSILRLLYLKPDSNYNTNEIIRNAQSGRGAVQRELEKLLTAELIIVQPLGNQKRYRANQNLPFYTELRSIIIKTFGLSDILSEELKQSPLSKQINIAFIYGSLPRQTDSTGSDIDLMLIGDSLTYADIFQSLKNVETTLGRKVNPTIYSLQDWLKKLKEGNNFIKQIVQQPKIFLIGTEDELKKLR